MKKLAYIGEWIGTILLNIVTLGCYSFTYGNTRADMRQVKLEQLAAYSIYPEVKRISYLDLKEKLESHSDLESYGLKSLFSKDTPESVYVHASIIYVDGVLWKITDVCEILLDRYISKRVSKGI